MKYSAPIFSSFSQCFDRINAIIAIFCHTLTFARSLGKDFALGFYPPLGTLRMLMNGNLVRSLCSLALHYHNYFEENNRAQAQLNLLVFAKFGNIVMRCYEKGTWITHPKLQYHTRSSQTIRHIHPQKHPT